MCLKGFEMAFRINCPKSESDEEWKDIRGCIKYEVSNKGRVRNTNTYQILKVSLVKGMYPYIKIQPRPGDQIAISMSTLMQTHWGKDWDPEEAANAR